MATFETFKIEFLRILGQPDFGEAPGSILPGKQSAGAKELVNSGANIYLQKESSARALYKLVRKYKQLVEEQPTVRQVSREASRAIAKFRDGQKTLATLGRRVEALDHSFEMDLDWETRDHFYNAIKELESVADKLLELEKQQGSAMHSARRQVHDRAVGADLKYQTSGWQTLLPPYDYELEALGKKAPQQWIVETLNSKLISNFTRAKIHVSQMTRYRVLSAVCSAGGIEAPSASTIRQYFIDRARRQSARKSPRD
jgi:hypothetical protein